MIFLCSDGLDDSKTLPVYTYRMRSDEDRSECLNDGTVTVFLNANGSSEGMSSEMREFLQYLKDGEARDNDGIVGHIHKLLIQARNHEEWKVEYMTLKLKLEETREAGRKEERAILSKLFHQLQEAGRGTEFAKAMSDEALLDKLLKEYGLSD